MPDGTLGPPRAASGHTQKACVQAVVNTSDSLHEPDTEEGVALPSPPRETGGPRHGFLNPVGTQRVLQIVLGLFWILDAALQYQPFMFGKQFVSTFVTGNASGQPEPLSWLITNVGHFISPDVGVWNFFFATIQLLIGIGLLFRVTVRPALGISFAWAFGIWVFGEGVGMILTGTATALTGAPGSVLIYGVLGLMAWPRKKESASVGERTSGVASSAAARGLGGVVTPLAVWGGYWVLAALLFLFPANRTQGSISGTITGMADGTPEWYAHFLNSFGNAFSSIGTQTSWVLAIVSVLIGIGPLVMRRYEIPLLVGILLSFVMWISGQGFLGGVLSGSGTDPNTGPLVILLGLAMLPAFIPDRDGWRSPLAAVVHSRPYVAFGSGVAVVCAIILAATYPAAASQSSGGSMPGMTGMSMSSGQSTTTATCTKANGGSTRAGLDITDTPNMVMGGPHDVMNMNGADASAAAGLNTTQSNWHYTGPALPAQLSQLLLAQGGNGPTTIHMAVTGCANDATAQQQIGATQYVQSTSEAAGHYLSPEAAMAAGYVAVSPTDYPVVYYVNPANVAADDAAKQTLNPDSIDGLVYAQTPSGQEVLVAAMYILPSSVATPPMPYGPLVQWHQRTDVCGPSSASATSPLQITGVTPCAPGSVQQATPYLTMVWQVPVAGGALAIQPPDIQMVEASVMATSS
jgi:hypothetical protein